MDDEYKEGVKDVTDYTPDTLHEHSDRLMTDAADDLNENDVELKREGVHEETNYDPELTLLAKEIADNKMASEENLTPGSIEDDLNQYRMRRDAIIKETETLMKRLKGDNLSEEDFKKLQKLSAETDMIDDHMQFLKKLIKK